MPEIRFARALAALAADSQLQQDFRALCDCGGRRAGTSSERAALKLAHERLAAIDSGAVIEPVAYAGWRCSEATLKVEDGTALACHALLGSQSTPPQGISAEVIDLGRGSPEDFERAAGDITGRLVLVRHEYPFSAVHVHRRRKYGWAIEHRAAGFIIANSVRDAGPVSGSSGRGGAARIPAVAIDYQSAMRLAGCGRRRGRAH